jgi:hypothetical protein
MTFNQAQAVWELCRQGLPLVADDAEEHWEKGEPFEMHEQLKLSWGVLQLIERCNWEVREAVEGRLH